MSVNAIYLSDREVWARALSDEELRAECNRRHLSIKRDEQLIEGLDAKLREQLSEWKRRAEAAERKGSTNRSEYQNHQRDVGCVAGKHCDEHSDLRCCGCGRPRDEPKGLAAWLPAATNDLLQFAPNESGPGISAIPKPADEHWVDPLDLLCEDA